MYRDLRAAVTEGSRLLRHGKFLFGKVPLANDNTIHVKYSNNDFEFTESRALGEKSECAATTTRIFSGTSGHRVAPLSRITYPRLNKYKRASHPH